MKEVKDILALCAVYLHLKYTSFRKYLFLANQIHQNKDKNKRYISQLNFLHPFFYISAMVLKHL